MNPSWRLDCKLAIMEVTCSKQRVLTPRNKSTCKYKRGLAKRTAFLEGWLQMQRLLEGETFTCVLNEELKSVLVKFIPSCSSLFLIARPATPSPPLSDEPDHKHNGGQLWSLKKVQMVGTGRKIREGPKVRNIVEQSSDNAAVSDYCLNIYYGKWPWKVAQLVSLNQFVVQTWQHWIKAFMQQERQTLSSVSILDAWLLCQYSKLKFQQDKPVFVVDAVSCFTGLRRWRACGVLSTLTKADAELYDLVVENANDVSFELYQYMYYSYMCIQRPEIGKLYHKFSRASNSKYEDDSSNRRPLLIMRRNYVPPDVHPPLCRQNRCGNRESSSHDTMMSVDKFHKFLTRTQANTGLTLTMSKTVIRQYDFQSKSSSEEPYLSVAGFAHCLLTLESLPHVKSSCPKIDTSYPLSSYFIASSHNTYLTGHQLHGDSSVTMYANVLQSGCRCVEIDCWDGEDGEPIVYHGHTLTSKLKFEQVVNKIGEYAFVASSFPLIISIENHCSMTQQEKMASYMKSSFGERLLSDFINGDTNPTTLPILEELKNKILIKNRKIPIVDAPLSPISPKLLKNNNDHANITALKDTVTSSLQYSPLVVSKLFNPSSNNATTELSVSSAPNTPNYYQSPPSHSLKRFNFVADKPESLSSRSSSSDDSKPMIKNCSHENSYSSLSVTSMPPMSTILEDDTNNEPACAIKTINNTLGPSTNGESNGQESQPHTTKRSNLLPNLDVIMSTMNCSGFIGYTTTETKNSISKEDMEGDGHNDGSCTEFCEHSVIDLTSHVCASRTSSSDSSQSECSTSSTNTNLSVLLGKTQSFDSYDNCYEDASTTKTKMVTPMIDDFIPAPSSSSCTLSNYRWIKSPSVCDTEDDAVLTVSRFSESVTELRGNTPTNDALRDAQNEHVLESVNDVPNEQSHVLNNIDSQTDEDCIDSIDGDSSFISPFSILASLDGTTSKASSKPTPECYINRNRPRSQSFSAVPSKNNSMYLNVFNLPASALRKHFKKSHSFSHSHINKRMLHNFRRGSVDPAVPTNNGSMADDPVCIDTVEASYSRHDIALQLSDLVIYTEARKFCGFKSPKTLAMKCTEMFSLSESCAKKAVKKTPNDVLRFTENHLLRVYPSATRFSSSNFNPAKFWMSGCQMVALNYQTADTWLYYYTTFFNQHNNCGYVLKPPELRSNTLKTEHSDITQMRLSIISAQCCSFTTNMSSLSLEIEVIGVPHECTRHKMCSTKVDSTCVYWEKENVVIINTSFPSLTALKFTLTIDKDTLSFSEMVLWSHLKPGYRHIYFMDDSLLTDNLPISLFFSVQFNDCYHDEMLEEMIVQEPTTVYHDGAKMTTNGSAKNASDNSFPNSIVVHYNELPELLVEIVSPFTVEAVVAKDALISGIGCLSSKEITSICPEMADPNDKEMVTTYFQLHLATKTHDHIINKIRLLSSEDLLYNSFRNQDSSYCLLISLKQMPACPINSESHKIGSKCVVSVENSVQICQEHIVSVEAKQLATTGSNKSVPNEVDVLCRVNYFSSSPYRNMTKSNGSCDIFTQSCDNSVLRKQRIDSNSSVFEIIHCDSHTNSQSQNVSRRQTNRTMSFTRKLRRKLFREKQSKSTPESVTDIEASVIAESSSRLLSYNNQASSYKHPRLRFSTKPSLEDWSNNDDDDYD